MDTPHSETSPAESNSSDSNASDSNASDSNAPESNMRESNVGESNEAESNRAATHATEAVETETLTDEAISPAAAELEATGVSADDVPGEPTAARDLAAADPLLNRGTSVPFPTEDIELPLEASQPFVGRWHRLVSHTNWEKGEIILNWRQSLVDDDAPATSYSDEAWSRMVGGVTSQHVGRLRRVYQKFGSVREQYDGLYWSHFQAALDWDDAELWLEGAVQNQWSVSQMRKQRWETLGADPRLKPDERDVIVADLDEDYEPLRSSADEAEEGGNAGEGSQGPRYEGPDFGDESEVPGEARATAVEEAWIGDDDAEAGNPDAPEVRPFEHLSELPEDVADAFDSFKLAIIRHRTAGWNEISCEQLLGCLDALKELAKLPVATPE